ncbi:MAG: hypothetical protein OIF51_07925 [Cellvibrionaceae bacterium]|nr:hypothetical protein [Cellvibrionaceae bacterium]
MLWNKYIDRKLNKKLTNFLYDPKPKTIVVKNLYGGNAFISDEIARKIAAHGGVTIRVDGACSSGCAYNILPAAAKVHLSKWAILEFHGFSLNGPESYSLTQGEPYPPTQSFRTNYFSSWKYLACRPIGSPRAEFPVREVISAEKSTKAYTDFTRDIMSDFAKDFDLHPAYASLGLDLGLAHRRASFSYTGPALQKLGYKNLSWDEGYPFLSKAKQQIKIDGKYEFRPYPILGADDIPNQLD